MIDSGMLSIIDVISDYFTVIHKGGNKYSTVEHDSFVIFPQTNSFCWFSASIAGGIDVFLRDVVGLSVDEIHRYTNGYILSSPLSIGISNNEQFTLDPNQYLGAPAIDNKYLINERMLSNETISRYKLECSTDRIIIPINTLRGKRIGSQFRYLDGSKPKYRTMLMENKPTLWPMPDLFLVPQHDIVLIFEGAMSVMRFYTVDKTVLSFGMYGNIKSRKQIESIKSLIGDTAVIVLVADPDAAGLMTAAKHLTGTGIKTYVPDGYPDEISDDEIKATIKNIRNLYQPKRKG